MCTRPLKYRRTASNPLMLQTATASSTLSQYPCTMAQSTTPNGDSKHNDEQSTTNGTNGTHVSLPSNSSDAHGTSHHSLPTPDIHRYSRQLILSQFGVIGQQCLMEIRVLIVGAGGLGSPVALYLAAAGVLHLTVIDNDTIDISNLHRQIIHDECNADTMSKADSAKASVLRINSSCHVNAVNKRFDYTCASDLVSQHDIIVDCSDNVATRYLINDTAVLHNKCVVSGSALRLDGQCTVYSYIDPYTHVRGPCYRCIFPVAPAATMVQSCADGGVMGPVVGVIGSIQANEVIKLACLLKYNTLVKRHYSNSNQSPPPPFTFTTLSGKLLLFDALNTDFKKITLRQRNKQCKVCGDHPTITFDNVQSESYSQQLGVMHDKPVMSCRLGERNNVIEQLINDKRVKVSSVDVQSLKHAVDDRQPHILIDVREPVQYNICHLPNSINIPLSQLSKRIHEIEQLLTQQADPAPAHKPAVYTVCRRGIDSIHAADILQHHIDISHSSSVVANVNGGLLAWHDFVDVTFPVY